MLDRVSPKRHGRGSVAQHGGQGRRYNTFRQTLPRNVFECTKEFMRVDLVSQSCEEIEPL